MCYKEEYGITPVNELQEDAYDAVIVAVAHKEFVAMGVDKIRKLGKKQHILFDVKHIFPKQDVDSRL